MGHYDSCYDVDEKRKDSKKETDEDLNYVLRNAALTLENKRLKTALLNKEALGLLTDILSALELGRINSKIQGNKKEQEIFEKAIQQALSLI